MYARPGGPELGSTQDQYLLDRDPGKHCKDQSAVIYKTLGPEETKFAPVPADMQTIIFRISQSDHELLQI